MDWKEWLEPDPKTVDSLLRILEEELKESRIRLIISRDTNLQDLYTTRYDVFQIELLNPVAQVINSFKSLLDHRIILPLAELITKEKLLFKEEKFWALTLGVNEEKVISGMKILKENEYQLNSEKVKEVLRNLGLEGEPPFFAGKPPDLEKRTYEELSKWRLFYALRDIYPQWEEEIIEGYIESWDDLHEFWIWEITSNIIWSLGKIGTKEAEESLLKILDVKLKEHESANSNPEIVESRTVKTLRYSSTFQIIERLYEMGNKNVIKILEDLLKTVKEVSKEQKIELEQQKPIKLKKVQQQILNYMFIEKIEKEIKFLLKK